MQASYSLELHALKAELQSSLARLGLEPVSSDSSSASLQDVAPPSRPVTRWNRRRLMREVAAASERRRELERQLQTEMHRDQQQQEQEELEELEQQQQSRRRAAWQAAIAELQQRRADIQRQMEREAAANAEMESYAEPEGEEVEEEPQETQRSGVYLSNYESVSETQYSIGGVVTLEPLSSTQRQASSARTGVTFRPAVAASGSTVPEVPVVRTMEAVPRVHYRNTPDALNDVFSLQLKFAETMLKLEKSVQMRDQLLHHGGAMVHKRRVGARTREENEEGRRRCRSHRKRSFESGSCSDASVEYRESRSSESFSSSAYSFSSLDSTPQRGTTIRVRYPNFGVSRATTAETLAPSSSGVDNLPGLGMNGTAPPVSSTNTTLSQQGSSPDTLRGTAADSDSGGDHAAPSRSTDEQPDENHRTPTTGSSVTTPTTGSDQKSTASSSKQVRFGDDAYSTPVLARKFNFDGLSIDEDEEEEKEEESVLSLLGGSSVTSAELNDASFVRAFERFRRELKAPKHNTVTQSPVQHPLARELFPVQNIDRPENVAMPLLEAVPTDSTSDVQDQTAEFPELEGLSVEELQERRRQLCLDIQAASAQLVLDFGGVQGGAENTKDRLMSLRDELKAVDARMGNLL